MFIPIRQTDVLMFIPIRQTDVSVEITYNKPHNELLTWLGYFDENKNNQVPKAYLKAARFSLWMKIQGILGALKLEVMDDITLAHSHMMARAEINKMIRDGGIETEQYLIDFYKGGEENNDEEENTRGEAIDSGKQCLPYFANIHKDLKSEKKL